MRLLVLAGLLGCQSREASTGQGPLAALAINDSVVSSHSDVWSAPTLDLVYQPPPGGFGLVYSIAVTADGHAFVYDARSPTERRALYLYRPDGTLIRKIGEAGTGPGEYSSQHPSLVALEGGRILISEFDQRRILVFDTAGVVVAELVGPDYRALRVVRAAGGGFWGNSRRGVPTADVSERWIHFDEQGAALDTVSLPGWGIGPTARADFAPRLISVIDGEGKLAAAWTGALRVVRESPAGLNAWVARIAPVPYLPDERLDLQLLWDHIRTQAAVSVGDIPERIPAEKPAIKQLRGFDWTGHLWVEFHGPSERDPDPVVRPPEDLPPGMSSFAWTESVRVGRFDAAGVFLGGVTLPAEATFLRGDGAFLWGTRISAGGEVEVARWRMPDGGRR